MILKNTILIFKSLVLLLICAAAFLLLGERPVYAASVEGVVIDDKLFPDEGFRKIVEKYDVNADGVLSDAEIETVQEISFFFSSVKSIQGITFFHNLTSLDCTGLRVAQLDLNCFPSLKVLNIPYNELTELDVASCPSLEELNCQGNRIERLSVSGCPKLKVLNCQRNLLTELDVRGCPALEEVNCAENRITSLVLHDCPRLVSLNCSGNRLETLDASVVPSLQKLCCNFNQLSALDVSGCPALITLDCIGNHMSQLRLGALPELKNLFCGSNWLSTLDLSGCRSLEKANCCYNRLTVLDMSGCPALCDALKNGESAYHLTPGVITYSVGNPGPSYPYSLETDHTKKLTIERAVPIKPEQAHAEPDIFCPLLHSDPSNWAMPELAEEYWQILTVRAQGAERMNYLDFSSDDYPGGDYPSRYFLYDIDKDGLPELIVEGSGAEANRRGYVFSQDSGHSVFVGSFSIGHTSLYTYPDENGILLYLAHMGGLRIDRIKLENLELAEETIVPIIEEYAAADYPQIETFVPGAVKLSYFCQVTNPILFRTWNSIISWLETGESFSAPASSWPEGNENFFENLVSSDGNVVYRGVIYRDLKTPLQPFSSLMDYERKTYSNSNSSEKHKLSFLYGFYKDFNCDGITDCLLLLTDESDKLRIPVILSYDSGTVYAYLMEDMTSSLGDIQVTENTEIDVEMLRYDRTESIWETVKAFFSKDCFLHVSKR